MSLDSVKLDDVTTVLFFVALIATAMAIAPDGYQFMDRRERWRKK